MRRFIMLGSVVIFVSALFISAGCKQQVNKPPKAPEVSAPAAPQPAAEQPAPAAEQAAPAAEQAAPAGEQQASAQQAAPAAGH